MTLVLVGRRWPVGSIPPFVFSQQLTRPKYGVITEEERTELLKRRFHGNNPNFSDAELNETHRVVKGERTCEQIISNISQGKWIRGRYEA